MGQALLRFSGIHPEDKRHPHIIKDFMTCLKRNIRNKIANRWAEMRNPPRTVQDAFKLAENVELHLQVADSFKLELSNNFPLVEVNEMSADETSGNKFGVNVIFEKVHCLISIIKPSTRPKRTNQKHHDLY